MRLDAATQLANLATQEMRDRTASFQGDDSWAAKLTLGQIIKGKILRSYGDGRYSVEFGGQQRVVDSSIPLSAAEQFRGRVVGLTDRVTIERLPEQNDTALAGEDSQLHTSAPQPQSADAVRDAAQLLNIRLTANEVAILASTAKKAGNPELVVRAGLFLAKLGLPLSHEFVRALHERISAAALPPGTSLKKSAPILDAEHVANRNVDIDSFNTTIRSLAQCLANACKAEHSQVTASEKGNCQADNRSSPAISGFASKSDFDGGDNDEPSDDRRRLGELLAGVLNVQTGARMQHRFQTLPVVIGGRLLEFDLALFDHAPRAQDGVKAKRLRFSLATEHGAVDVDATALDDHVQIAFTSRQARFLDALEEHTGILSAELKRHGWQLAGSNYRQTDARSPACAIIDHVLAQDSLRIAL